MLCVANKPIMLSVIMLNVIILSVMAPLKQMCSSISPITELPFIQIFMQKIKQQKDISAAIFWQKLADVAMFISSKSSYLNLVIE